MSSMSGPMMSASSCSSSRLIAAAAVTPAGTCAGRDLVLRGDLAHRLVGQPDQAMM
jgi:hypothetical protein